jgi:hypothetical protein
VTIRLRTSVTVWVDAVPLGRKSFQSDSVLCSMVHCVSRCRGISGSDELVRSIPCIRDRANHEIHVNRGNTNTTTICPSIYEYTPCIRATSETCE